MHRTKLPWLRNTFIFYSKQKNPQNHLTDTKTTPSGYISSRTPLSCTSPSSKKTNNDDTLSLASSSNATAFTDTSGTGTEYSSTKTFDDEPTLHSSIRSVPLTMSFTQYETRISYIFQ